MTKNRARAQATPELPAETQSIRIFIFAEVCLYREGLGLVLGQQTSMEVVGTNPSRETGIGALAALTPDVVLLDLAMADGLAAAREIRAAFPNMKVVALGVREIEADIIAWAEAGMSGYVSREGSLRELVQTIRRAIRGEAVCSPQVTATILQRLSALASTEPGRAGQRNLTARELAIVRLIGQGHSNKEIARALSIALPTVKNHVHHILEKLEVRRRADAVTSVVASRWSPTPARADRGI